jgi:hypothetical protein
VITCVHLEAAARVPGSAKRQGAEELAVVCRIKALRRLHCCALPVGGFREGGREVATVGRGEGWGSLNFRLGGLR